MRMRLYIVVFFLATIGLPAAAQQPGRFNLEDLSKSERADYDKRKAATKAARDAYVAQQKAARQKMIADSYKGQE